MKLRVAAYCRVSTDQEDQRNSLENQKRYFNEFIMRNLDWQLVRIFAEEGVSGTSAQARPAFQQMLQSALHGEIDLILTKEVSRFARNTVDALSCTRKLSTCGVGVVFINDNIDTRQNDGEFRLTIMASVAQEESRKISERVKWGQQRAMENGVVFGGNHIYGYVVKNGAISVQPEQSAIVKKIYQMFLQEGKGTYVIARVLSNSGVATPTGKSGTWLSSTVLNILRNEKYCGDLLQKKYYTSNFLTHQKKRNRGQEKKIYLPSHHEPIVSRECFDAVQRELARREEMQNVQTRYSGRFWCSGKIICGECGGRFVPKRRKRKNGEDYRYWICHTKTEAGQMHCTMRTVNANALRTCAVFLLGKLDFPVGRLTEITLALISVEERKEAEADFDADGRKAEQKLETALDAYLDGQIGENELELMRVRYKKEIQCIEEKRHIIEVQKKIERWSEEKSSKLRAFLKDAFDQPEMVGRIIEQIVVFQDSLLFEIFDLPYSFRIMYQASGKGRNYHVAITDCVRYKKNRNV